MAIESSTMHEYMYEENLLTLRINHLKRSKKKQSGINYRDLTDPSLAADGDGHEHDLQSAALRPTNLQALLQCEVNAGQGEGSEEIND